MASLKAREIESFIRKPDFTKPVILLFGPDSGLVSERADQLAKKSGVDLSDPFSLIRLDADDAAVDVERLASEAHTIGMFGGKRLIRISGTTRRDLAKSVKPVLETPPEDAIIIMEAGDLRKSSGLRKLVEASPVALCIPCYEDNDTAIERLIDEEIIQKGFSVDNQTRLEIKSLLGSDRKLSRNELQKLALYCDGQQTIELSQVHEIMGDASKLVLDALIDSVSTGNAARLQTLLPKALEAGNQPDIIALSLLRQFQMLQLAREKVEKKRVPARSVVDGLRPPVHFSRKDAVGRAISLWPLARIENATGRLHNTILECRKNAGVSQSICSTALLSLCLEAQVLARR